MNLKKSLKIKKAQASLEYLLIFAAIILISLISLSSFFPNVRETIQGQDGYFKKAVERIISADRE